MPDSKQGNPFASILRDYDLNPYIHPLEVRSAYAAHIIDSQGNDHIDFLSGWGTNLLGYGYPRVAQAIADQARGFASPGLPHHEFRELQTMLCELIPCAESVRFGKNGSDVTAAAVRLARAITGRERVLYRGFHGFHDWYMASTECQGIPMCLSELVMPLEELSAASVETAFSRYADQIACVILNPLVWPIPTGAEIERVIEVCHSHGAVVVFDEMMSGFRLAPGGMQELWCVEPDLACFGKAIANGMPLAVLAGRAEYMAHMPRINYGMTFEAEAISIAAALATLLELTEKDVVGALHTKGRTLREAYDRVACAYDVNSTLVGPEPCAHLHFEDHPPLTGRELQWLVVQELSLAGIFTLGSFIMSYSHTDDDLTKTAGAFEVALEVAHRAIKRGTVHGFLDPRVHAAMNLVDGPARWRGIQDVRIDLHLAATESDEARANLASDPNEALNTRGIAAGSGAGSTLPPCPTGVNAAHRNARRVNLLLMSSIKDYTSGDTESGRMFMVRALAIDPGLAPREFDDDDVNPSVTHLDRILANAAHPCTLSALANINVILHHMEAAERLFTRYLSLAPEAADSDRVEEVLVGLVASNRLGCSASDSGTAEQARIGAAERAVLEIDPGLHEDQLGVSPDPLGSILVQVVDTCRHATTLLTLAHLRRLRHDLDGAHFLYRSYLKRKPIAADRPAILENIGPQSRRGPLAGLFHLARRAAKVAGMAIRGAR